MAVLEVVVGRQPVFDRELDVIGYELLFRGLNVPGGGTDGPGGAAPTDGDLMTAAVLYSSVSIGMSRLVGDKLAFCNAGRKLLVGIDPVVLPAEQTVIEVHAAMVADEEVVAGCGRLVRKGFLLALDHYTGAPEADALLQLASIVKVDAGLHDEAKLAELVGRGRAAGALAVAERVETEGELERCKALGFDLFQGYLLSEPRVVPGRTLDSSSVGRLQLAAALIESECSAERLEEIVKAEPAMAYQLIQMAGIGADHGFRRQIRTIREALVIVGWRQLQSWISFLLLTHRGETSEEEVVASLARAKMCELVAGGIDPSLAGFAFTAGMLSSFDVLLGMDMEEVLLSLPLDSELHDAVLGRDGGVGRIVADVVDYQRDCPEQAVRSGVDPAELHRASSKALAWAIRVSSGFAKPSTSKAPIRAMRRPA